MMHQAKSTFVSLVIVGLFSVLNANTLDDCEVAYKAGDFKKAENLCVQSTETNKNSLKAYRITTEVFYQEGEYKKALPYAKKTESLAKTKDDYRMIYNRLSTIYSVLGDKKEELRYVQKFLDMSIKNGNKKEIATAYNNLGIYYHKLNQLDEALKYYNKGLGYDEKSVIYENIGSIYGGQKNYILALKNILKAIEINKGEVDTDNRTRLSREAHIRVSAVIAMYKLGEYGDAEDMLSKSLAISQREGFRDMEAYALYWYGQLYVKKGEETKAKTYFIGAYKIYDEIGDSKMANGCLGWIKGLDGNGK